MQDSKENIYPTDDEPISYDAAVIKYRKDKKAEKVLSVVDGAAKSAQALVSNQLARNISNLKAFETKQADGLKAFKNTQAMRLEAFKANILAEVIAAKVKADIRLKKAATTASAVVKRQNF